MSSKKSSFFKLSASLYSDPSIDINDMTVQDIMNYLSWDIEYSYAQKVVAFVRQLKDGCYFSLPEGTQKSISWMDEHNLSGKPTKDISSTLGVSNYHVRLAKTFLEMEDRGYFDNENAYDLV